MSFVKVTIEASIERELQKVWNAWTSPQHITQWNFASDDWCCPSANSELKKGGRYVARMEAKDGSFGFDFEGVYEDLVAPSFIALRMGDGRLAETRFEGVGKTTKVTTVFDAEGQNPIDMQREGWQAILNNFKKYVESL
ncbi:MAG: activator of HSP90 ATPase [Deltaproteobacteria bacterium]|nr:activator of HSP90 ATPase [Deltaproteobacteria bacterium]